MPLLFIDSCGDDGDNATCKGWSQTPASFAGGRTGKFWSMGTFPSTDTSRTFPNLQRVYLGLAVNSAGTGTPIELRDGGSVQIAVQFNGSGQVIQIKRGTTVIAATAADQVFLQNFWLYFELMVFIHPTLGEITLKANGITWLSLTGLNTQNTANAFVNGLRLYSNNSPQWSFACDDLYLADDAFYGGLKIEALKPNGNGASSQWVGSDGDSLNNFQLVDEPNQNSDTDYVKSPNVGDKDTWGYSDLSSTSVTVRAVQVYTVARRDDALARKFRHVIRSGGSDHAGSEFSVDANYSGHDYRDILTVDPATGVGWTAAAVNAAEFGVEVTA